MIKLNNADADILREAVSEEKSRCWEKYCYASTAMERAKAGKLGPVIINQYAEDMGKWGDRFEKLVDLLVDLDSDINDAKYSNDTFCMGDTIEAIKAEHIEQGTNLLAIDIYFKDKEEGCHAADLDLDTGKLIWRRNAFRGNKEVMSVIYDAYQKIHYPTDVRVRVVGNSLKAKKVDIGLIGIVVGQSSDAEVFVTGSDGAEIKRFHKWDLNMLPGGSDD